VQHGALLCPPNGHLMGAPSWWPPLPRGCAWTTPSRSSPTTAPRSVWVRPVKAIFCFVH